MEDNIDFKQYWQKKKDREIADLKEENKRLKLRIHELEMSNALHIEVIKDNIKRFTKENPSASYNQEWSWIRKMAYVIHKADKPLQINEISDKLREIDEYTQSGCMYDSNKIYCTHLLRAIKTKRLSRCKISGNGGYFYCLPEWIQGDVLEEEYLNKIRF